MTEDVGEVFAVMAEFKDTGPFLMETDGPRSSREKAYEQMRTVVSKPHCLRAAVVRLTHDGGNELLIHDMKRMQE